MPWAPSRLCLAEEGVFYIIGIGLDRGSGKGAALNETVNNDVQLEKLYISDDDIQDDWAWGRIALCFWLMERSEAET